MRIRTAQNVTLVITPGAVTRARQWRVDVAPDYQAGVAPKGRKCETCPTTLSIWNPQKWCAPCARANCSEPVESFLGLRKVTA